MDSGSLVAELEKLGYTKESGHLQKLLGGKTDDDVIPTFQNDAGKESEISKILTSLVVKRRKHAYRENIITDDDIAAIEKCFPGFIDSIPLSSLNLDKIRSKISEKKADFLLSETIMKRFIHPKRKIFESAAFVEFVKMLSHVQLGMLVFLVLDGTISDTVDEKLLFDWTGKYCQMVSSLDRLADDLDWFSEFYVTIISSRLQFFMNGSLNAKYDLKKLITSKSFVQFVHMDDIDPSSNPASLKNSTWVYNLYVNLDSDKKGMLSQEDIKRIDTEWFSFKFSDAFTSRVFEVLPTFEGNLDFALFMYLIWPLRYISEPQSVHFFFQIFDVDEDGKVGILDLRYFYKSLVEEGIDEQITFEYYMAEIFDMCQCQDDGFTEQMLLDSGKHDEIIKMMIDAHTLESNNSEEEEKM